MAITQIKIDGAAYPISDHRIVEIDDTPASGSDNLITSGAVYDAIRTCDDTWLNNELSNLFPL